VNVLIVGGSRADRLRAASGLGARLRPTNGKSYCSKRTKLLKRWFAPIPSSCPNVGSWTGLPQSCRN